ncbi:L-seryl-tRNA(Sec) selenium transferase [Thermohalobacter berrensis]|uniref:L-seryl-tRNA(Sec) selenium transferase n=1 Tax=Thermohalobacter berrensis TaxID=99594 RepID=A0A419T512_9FIRM|nr:L-seryl-tRNA(Sec) selenium transferase [Thermohalobacter berrensis]RKD32478.1 L-seryl-tRNA(Sec) selenium transferase [Thermohalobacter berrensis]
MKDKAKLFSKLPKVDQVLSNDNIKKLMKRIPRDIIVESIREELDLLRKKIKDGIIISLKELEKEIIKLPNNVTSNANEKIKPKFKRVINATGVVIHTNLGRSLISPKIIDHIKDVTTNYSNLEFDLDEGKRGSRYSHIEEIIAKVTGAESAMVVNNNAAAVLLVLSTIAKEKEVVVSRGELVEIGGSFRVPDVMEQSGAKLVDVGTTNKTHIWDYERAIGEDTAALLKVHTSNYRILGFTSSVKLEDLVKLGERYNIPVVEDLGSGVLVDLSKYGLQYEPTVQESIKAGVDIVTFSGDKLLGGPQAGIIIGKKKYIDEMKKNPLTRAIRIDKFTISALEATLRLYLNEEDAIKNIPTLKMLTTSLNELEKKAQILYRKIDEKVEDNISIKITDQFSQVGGGSMPLEEIPTKAIMISSNNHSVSNIERKLRKFHTPIVARIYKDNLFIDLRTVKDEELDIIAEGLKFAIENV